MDMWNRISENIYHGRSSKSSILVTLYFLLLFPNKVCPVSWKELSFFTSISHCNWLKTLHKKWSFPLKISSVNVNVNPDLVTFTEEIFNGKFNFLCSESCSNCIPHNMVLRFSMLKCKCLCPVILNLKLVSAIFYQIFIFSPNDRPSKIMKNIFISSEKLFWFSRYSNFCNIFPSFPHFPDSKGQMEVE